MHWLLLAGWTALAGAALFAIGFLVASLLERERRAALVTAAFAVPGLGTLAFILAVDHPARPWTVATLLVIGFIGVWAICIRREPATAVRVVGPRERVDERDAVFHRFYRLREDTPEFEAYYAAHPEKRRFDDAVRRLPGLASPDSPTYRPLTAPFQVAAFDQIEAMAVDIEWTPRPLAGHPIAVDPAEASARLRGFALHLGAHSVGCTRLDPTHVYSHIARGPGRWGDPIELRHTHAIAVTVEMGHGMVALAPDAPTTTETAIQYLECGKIALVLARYLNLLGYEARAHVDGNYRVMCVPVAVDAGLGELGRLGLLMTPGLGPRVRIAVVTTNLELAQDAPIAFGVQDFCTFCKKCAECCPSGSIDSGVKTVHAGVEKWQTRRDTCYRHWRRAGSDCALCVRVCPYSHPATLTHDMLRRVIGRNHLARRMALWADDLAYGRRPGAGARLPAWHG